mgnify:CR=1 FL=1
MSLERALRERRAVSFPRVSGDEPAMRKRSKDLYTFSPRERG